MHAAYIHIHIHIKYIYTETYPFLDIPITKKPKKDNDEINCKLLCQKKVNSSSDPSSLIFNF